MYLGFEATAINREIATVLEAAYRIRTRKAAKTLAVGETAVFALAEAAISTGPFSSTTLMRKLKPNSKAIAKGILCALTFLVDRDINDDSCAQVDADQDPHSRSVDPFGNDYFCKLCDHELANTYFHCQGCEDLLQMDFNICHFCFRDGKYRCNVDMKPYVTNPKGCHDHHNGGSSMMRCTLGNEGCTFCDDVCDACVCTCHRTFTKRQRFRSDEKGRKLLTDCMVLAGDEPIPYFSETLKRLQDSVEQNDCANVGVPMLKDEEGASVHIQDHASPVHRQHGNKVFDLEIAQGSERHFLDDDAFAAMDGYDSDTSGAPV